MADILENYELDIFWPVDVLPYLGPAFTCKRKESTISIATTYSP